MVSVVFVKRIESFRTVINIAVTNCKQTTGIFLTIYKNPIEYF